MDNFNVFLKTNGVSVVITHTFDENGEMNVHFELNHTITNFSKTETVGKLLRFANNHRFDILAWFESNGWNTTSYYNNIEIAVYGQSVFSIEKQKVVEFKVDPTRAWNDYLR